MHSKRFSPEERRILLDEKRLELENSFARKWLPALATTLVPLVTIIIGVFQLLVSMQETQRTNIEQHYETQRAESEAENMSRREWEGKAISMYINERHKFDILENPTQASTNLIALSVLAPKAAQSILDAEQTRIPGPSADDVARRNTSLAAVSLVQNSLPERDPEEILRNSSFIVHILYSSGMEKQASEIKSLLIDEGFRISNTAMVKQAPASLEIRYYRRNQNKFVEQLSENIKKKTGMPVITKHVVSANPLPAGMLEIWLPITKDK